MQGGLSTVRLSNFDFHSQVKLSGHEAAMVELKFVKVAQQFLRAQQ